MVSIENRILLFSLCTISATIAFTFLFAASSEERNGMRKWAFALISDSASWLMFALHFESAGTMAMLLLTGAIFLSILALSFKLAAIYEYCDQTSPRWLPALPLAALAINLVFIATGPEWARITFNSLMFAALTLAIALRLKHDPVHEGRRPRLLVTGSQYVIAILLLLRATNAVHGGSLRFPGLSSTVSQSVGFLLMTSLSITATMGFILLLKRRSDQEIRSLAMTDVLTGIYNRRAFIQRAEQECALAQRNGIPLALLMIDVDHFKQINDLYGHPIGDKVLLEIATLLGERLRKQDTLARYGGEEFCVLLPGTDETGAFSIAENLRRTISATSFNASAAAISTTISIGVSVRAPSHTPFQEDFHCLLSAADAALYQAKHDGRNCIVTVNSLRTTQC